MTAEPTGHVMWSPDLVRQRLAGHTLADVLKLPDDSATELLVRAPFDIRLPIRDITP